METAANEVVQCPFVVLIDSNEGSPFSFENIVSDAASGHRVIQVEKRWCSLGRWPVSFGDYSIEGCIGRVGIERKSMEDVWGTILGWESHFQKDHGLPSRRQRFIDELRNLNAIESAAVIVEASFGQCCVQMPAWGRKTQADNVKIFHRSIISFMQQFPRVQWIFCDTRRMAEVTTFRWLHRFWKECQR